MYLNNSPAEARMYMQNPSSLAIVIPFYKISYFEVLLDALSRQTDSQFNLYVGDDCSDDNPQPIIEKYVDKLNIIYCRFTQRLGHISLTRQWQRCVELTQDENWIWIIPDDDIPSLNCVEEIKNVATSSEVMDVNVLRLPLRLINENGEVVKSYPAPKKLQNAYEYYLNQLKSYESGSTLGDNVFRKNAFLNCGGFVDFPKAWCSDHATVLKVSAGKSIYCIQNTYFCFRQSGFNISSQRDDGAQKMSARVMYIKWLKANEFIFPVKLTPEFYRYVYWRGEYYVLNEWQFSIGIFWHLMRSRWLCLGNLNPLPVLWMLRNKIKYDYLLNKKSLFKKRYGHD